MPTDAGTPPSPAQQFEITLRRLISSKQWDRALDAARQWLSVDPENPDPHLAAGQALVNLHKFSDAEIHILKVLAARADHVFALRLASIVAEHQGKSKMAEDHIQRAIEIQPNNPRNWLQFALLRYRQGNLDIAEQYARRSLELQPDNADTLNLIANCQRGNPGAQLAQYLQALELNPENATVHNNIGAYYFNTARDYAAAEASFRRSLQIDPTNRLARKNLFSAIRQRDRLYRVLTWLPTMMMRTLQSPTAHSFLMRIGLLLFRVTVGLLLSPFCYIWAFLVAPLVRAYEYLTLSDIRATAGVVGARRGGFFNSHRWPVSTRLSIFALLVLSFWGGVFCLYKTLPGWLIFFVMLVFLGSYITAIYLWCSRAISATRPPE